MNNPTVHELEVVLSYQAFTLSELEADVSHDLSAMKKTAAMLDRLEASLVDLVGPIEDTDTSPVPVPRVMQAQRTATWERIRDEAEQNLRQRRLDPTTVSIDGLLDSEVVAAIDRRFDPDFEIKTRVDVYDVAIAVAAGLAAAAVDVAIVRIPKNMTYLGQHEQAGSVLTAALRKIKIPKQSWLEKHCKTSFDGIVSLEGFGGPTHRLLTPGHDPLIGLIFGTIDIMRGSLTAIDANGGLAYFGEKATPLGDPLTALAMEIGHLLSDGFTKMGLPIPGWGLTQTLQFGGFGPKGRTGAELALFMYVKGYDSRHFLTMATSVAAAETIVRAYFALRQGLDASFADYMAQEGVATGSNRLGHSLRFMATATIAHMVACACNAGKIAIYHGNPLALNYAQWLRFIQSLFAWQHAKYASPSAVLRRRLDNNLDYLHSRWPKEAYEAADCPRMSVTVAAP